MEISEFVERFKGKTLQEIMTWYSLSEKFWRPGVIKGGKIKENSTPYKEKTFYRELEIAVGRYAAGDIPYEKLIDEIRKIELMREKMYSTD